MPHLILEYSDNIIESDFIELLQRCHTLLTRLLPTQLESCKSRVLKHAVYCVGDGKPQNAFVSVTLKIMPGRSADTLESVSAELMKLFKTHFSASLKTLICQITLEIVEISNFYSKL